MRKSVLEGRDSLKRKIDEVAEVAGYLWQKGWAERNGGNITVNVTEYVDDVMASLPAIGKALPVGLTLSALRGCWFYCKGTGKRMRDLAADPMRNGALIRILEDGKRYEIVADEFVRPTSELLSHLAVHNDMVEKGIDMRATLHTHPTELVAMSHNPDFSGKDVLSVLLWSMIPETRAFCPKGLGFIRYELPGSIELARATIAELQEYDVVLWEKHGTFSVGHDIEEAFDFVDVLNKSAEIYMKARSMGFNPAGMTEEQMKEMSVAFNLPK